MNRIQVFKWTDDHDDTQLQSDLRTAMALSCGLRVRFLTETEKQRLTKASNRILGGDPFTPQDVRAFAEEMARMMKRTRDWYDENGAGMPMGLEESTRVNLRRIEATLAALGAAIRG